MRSAAEIGKLAGAIDRNLFIGLGELLDEMALHEVAFFFELLQSLLARQKLARVGNVLLHQFLHFLLDLFQVLRSKRSGTIEVVEKSGFRGGAVPELGFREKLQDRRRQKMSGGMPVNFQRLRVTIGQDAKIGVFLQRASEIDEVAVGFRDKRSVRQSLADGLGDIKRTAALG